MNISQAKLINLVDFLEQEGHKAVKQRGNIYWYNSPIRSESAPSFKVDSRRNEWYDYGLGKGGDIWKSRACLTPEGKAALTPENLLFLTPVKS